MVGVVSLINIHTHNNISKKLISFQAKDTKFFFKFLAEHYKIKMDLISYYVLPLSTSYKYCSQK